MSNTELLVFGASCPTTGRLSSQMLERHLQADHLSLIGMRMLERDKVQLVLRRLSVAELALTLGKPAHERACLSRDARRFKSQLRHLANAAFSRQTT
jgi:hypothetical protein